MKPFTAASACLAALALAGCAAHTHSLLREVSDRGFTMGTFQHNGSTASSMVLEFEGQRFEANGFVIERKQNLAELRRQYGSGKHYDQIFSGLDTDHYVYSAEPKLRAENGATLRCSAVWRRCGVPAGHCVTTKGIHINFRFE